MTTQTFYGKILHKSRDFPIYVTASATSPSATSKIIKAQYGSSFKQWASN